MLSVAASFEPSPSNADGRFVDVRGRACELAPHHSRTALSDLESRDRRRPLPISGIAGSHGSARRAQRRRRSPALALRDDTFYVDHWAVRLDSHHVIDPTRVQVDGKRQLVSLVDHYPDNYADRRSYPATLHLVGAAAALETTDRRLPSFFRWGCGIRCFRHDAGKAIRSHAWRSTATSVVELARFVVSFTISTLTDALEKRMVTFVGRMRERAEVSALSPASPIQIVRR